MTLKPASFRPILYAFLILLCFLKVPDIYAQQKTAVLRGAVTNNEGAPVAGVSIIVKNARTNFNQGTSTDSSGDFTIPAVPTGGGYTITLSAIGYESETLSRFTVKEKSSEPL